MDELRAELDSNGLDVARLEEGGRFRFVVEPDPSARAQALRRLLDEEEGGRSIWVSFDLTKQIDLETALRQQEELAELIEAAQIVIKTVLLERVADGWPPATQRRAQVLHSGTIWLSEAGLALSRVTPVPPT